jgi:hypothetical protein
MEGADALAEGEADADLDVWPLFVGVCVEQAARSRANRTPIVAALPSRVDARTRIRSLISFSYTGMRYALAERSAAFQPKVLQ